MENGSNLYTPVVFTLNDLKKIYDEKSHGYKGMWAFHRNFHKGHERCKNITLKKCDWTVGFLWNNNSAGIEELIGESIDHDDPIHTSDIKALKENCDVAMIFTGDYHPYLEYRKLINETMDKYFPKEMLKEKGILQSIGMYGSLIYSVAVRIMIHEIYGIKIDYHAVGGKDRWRFVGYTKWCYDNFGIITDIVNPISDKFGNNYSNMKVTMNSEFSKRINKKLLLPYFNSIEDVNNHIKDIEGLKAEYFTKENGWIHVKFYFDKYKWWTEALKL